jgi:hypothetical protein
VGALDGRPIPGASVEIDGVLGPSSDAAGQFSLHEAEGVHALRVEESATQPRSTHLRVPGGPVSISLIPREFDLVAFDEMLRYGGRLRRWTRPPRVVILKPVLRFVSTPGVTDYEATTGTSPQEELDELRAHLGWAYGELTQGWLGPLTSLDFEDAAPGTRVSIQRAETIVVARYEGLQAATGYWGYGGWAEDATGAASGGYVQLDRGPDNGPNRQSLRAHELGHALGYMHVTSRTSVMNASATVLPGEWDHQAVVVAFQRPPGNTSPDNDPATWAFAAKAGRATGPLSWSTPVP